MNCKRPTTNLANLIGLSQSLEQCLDKLGLILCSKLSTIYLNKYEEAYSFNLVLTRNLWNIEYGPASVNVCASACGLVHLLNNVLLQKQRAIKNISQITEVKIYQVFKQMSPWTKFPPRNFSLEIQRPKINTINPRLSNSIDIIICLAPQHRWVIHESPKMVGMVLCLSVPYHGMPIVFFLQKT